jgi:hypothetical protein
MYMMQSTQEPVVKGGLRALAEDLARDINRHATVVLSGRTALQGELGQGRPSGGDGGGGEGGSRGSGVVDVPGVDGQQLEQQQQQHVSGLEDLKSDPEPTFELLTLRGAAAVVAGAGGSAREQGVVMPSAGGQQLASTGAQLTGWSRQHARDVPAGAADAIAQLWSQSRAQPDGDGGGDVVPGAPLASQSALSVRDVAWR